MSIFVSGPSRLRDSRQWEFGFGISDETVIHGYTVAAEERGLVISKPRRPSPYELSGLTQLLSDYPLDWRDLQPRVERDARAGMGRQLQALARHCGLEWGLYNSYELRTRIPMEKIEYRMRALMESPPFAPFGQEDARALLLARWFKEEYMAWVDPIKCPACGGETRFVRSEGGRQRRRNTSEANDAISLFDAADPMKEYHRCVDQGCGVERVFLRHTSPVALMQTREGRCGG